MTKIDPKKNILGGYMQNIDENGMPFSVPSGRYYAVWVQIETSNAGIVPMEQVRRTKKWVHHFSASSREDARDEARYCRLCGDKTKIIRQNW